MHDMRKLAKGISTLILALTMTINVFAQDTNEVLTTVKESVTTVLSDLKENRELYKQDSKALNRLIDEKALPYFDEKWMTAVALGKNNWRQATKQQQTDLVDEVKQLMMRTYSVALLDYADAKVNYGNVSMINNNRFATVDVTVVNADGSTYPLTLTLSHSAKRARPWLISDVEMEGVKITDLYSTMLQTELSERGSLDGVIKYYHSLNEAGSVLN